MKKLINPFRYLPTRQASCWGIAAMIMTAIFCWVVQLRMSSVSQVMILGQRERLWMSTVEQVAVWLIFAIVLYVIGLVASKSRVRLVDVASFNLFARIPLDLSLLIFAVPKFKAKMWFFQEQAEAMSRGDMSQVATIIDDMWYMTVFGIISLLFAVWYFYWSYKGFAESTNIKNGKGVILFIVGFVVAYVMSGYLLKLL